MHYLFGEGSSRKNKKKEKKISAKKGAYLKVLEIN